MPFRGSLSVQRPVRNATPNLTQAGRSAPGTQAPKEAAGAMMNMTRKTLFEVATLQIGMFAARPASDACLDVERQAANAIALPVSGVFAKHDAPGHDVVGTPAHAVFFAADRPYRIGFPGAIGDRALTLRFGSDVAPELIDGGLDTMAS